MLLDNIINHIHGMIIYKDILSKCLLKITYLYNIYTK